MNNRRASYDGVLTKQRDPLEAKASGEQGILTGYASKWWVVDSYAEATAPGSFAETIAQRGPKGADRILLRYEHLTTIGTHRVLTEDETGLAIEGHISDDGMDGTRVRRHLADGVKYGLSIGFRRLADRTAEESDPLDFSSAPAWVQALPRNEIRILTRIKLYEDSVVSFPAVEPATVDSYRADPPDLDALLDALKAGRLTAEQRAQLQELLKDPPADVRQADGETLAAAPVTQTAIREREAAFAIRRAQLAALGIGV